MNRGIGATTFGTAMLLMGLTFPTHHGGSLEREQGKQVGAAPAATPRTSDGPWLASCKYWSAAKVLYPVDHGDVPPAGRAVDPTRAGEAKPESSEDETPCGSTVWRIPEGTPNAPEISVIIATVPDPIHSHLALEFDRSIEAIRLAAADNRYLSSYYWLPWRSQIRTSSTGESTSGATKATAEDNDRERQPGLIILRYAPDEKEWSDRKKPPGNLFEWTNYGRVVYLFLVAETPALGVNGDQLQNAFLYERILKGCYGAKLSIRPMLPRSSAGPTTRPTCPIQLPPAAASTPVRAQSPSHAVSEQQPVHVPVSVSPPAVNGRHGRDAPQKSVHPAPIVPTDEGQSWSQVAIIGPFYSGSASSLHAGVEAALPELNESHASITGMTGTRIAARELDPEEKGFYFSFGENADFEEQHFLDSLVAAKYDLSRVALLSEEGTVFGNSGRDLDLHLHGLPLSLRFPRELSLLRNAEPSQSSKSDSSAPPTPYLNLSLKDYAADDNVPRFSTNQSPLSVEAQLMAIAHQLQRAHSQFILITASNVLDEIFLVQFFHHSCPDARLVLFGGGDLLFARDGEDAPFVGSISISPYLLSSLDFRSRTQWVHVDYQAEEIYNAASYTFWNGTSNRLPQLSGYTSYPREQGGPPPRVQFQRIPLWASVLGSDGYYPLAILDWCASDQKAMLPTLTRNREDLPELSPCEETQVTDKTAPNPREVWTFVPESINENSGISPSLPWGVLCGFICLACLLHIGLLWGADLWSPLTRDLAMDQNDLPHRRSVYLNIGTSMLLAMGFVTAFPLLRVGHFFHLAAAGHAMAWVTLALASLSGLATLAKTGRYCFTRRSLEYSFFNLLAPIALFLVIALWIAICCMGNVTGNHSYVGLYFSYRCLRPLSGVCPLLPVFFLLFGWYLWSIYQTARLRFSDIHRPRLPHAIHSQHSSIEPQFSLNQPEPYSPSHIPYPLFVSDETLASCSQFRDNCLYANISCLLISREVLDRFLTRLKDDPRRSIRVFSTWVFRWIDPALLCIYLCLFALCVFAIHIHTVEGFLSPALFRIDGMGPTGYELLIMALFFPLIMVALSGWLRVILIWGSLSRGLLEPLERMPIRFAFTRYKAGGWMSMLRQKGLHLRWRDMGRTTESIRQIVHHPELEKQPSVYLKLLDEYEIINRRLHELVQSIHGQGKMKNTAAALSDHDTKAESPWPGDKLWDLPEGYADLRSIFYIEQGFARFCSILIEDVLDPYWDQKRIGLVESIDCSTQGKDKSNEPDESSLLEVAEELIVVRYVSLIRAALVNIRYLMLFVSSAFVLALIAWNSYPFQPHAFIDWCFTLLLAILTLGFLSVFAQMHRNAILSRLTNTTANELGWEFYVRIATFGAVPMLAWLAYQFPQVGGSLYRMIEPGFQFVK